MDYPKLLFALEVRKLAFLMLEAEGYTFEKNPEKFPAFMEAALKEALGAAKFIEKALQKPESN